MIKIEGWIDTSRHLTRDVDLLVLFLKWLEKNDWGFAGTVIEEEEPKTITTSYGESGVFDMEDVYCFCNECKFFSVAESQMEDYYCNKFGRKRQIGFWKKGEKVLIPEWCKKKE